ncbi:MULTISPECIES: CocE/NonD family hydrolase [unclassified Crossiella]|uniref:CocE/NonD family hydrolase n=1 Tax=unclassified Crossiella TaxID=2620835 RepID=UPI001FFE4AB4|nr:MULTISPECIES: CocE/NonD family hydrolase [unclassified Crossiella]MCK2237204.1 dienelactone hydrolase family protein [Crossiella sp. S99.2]MCK2250859.1 dienelactone hydrolase family protein [Crossiella sp. S99.1]
MRRFVLLLLAALTALVTSGSLAPVASAAPAGPEFLTITGKDGTKLGAHVFRPAGPGPHPAVVLISSWSVNNLEYIAQTRKLAEAGYVALSYTTRGFWESGGTIEVAGPEDISDASSAIDWVLANTSADPAKIGLAGVSYGAGISMLTAAKDKRVRAVAALSAWADLAAALLPNQTWSQQAIGLLALAGKLTGRPGQKLNDTLAAYDRNDRVEAMKLAPERSPAQQLAGLNANKPAVLIANGWSDSLFPAGQIADFYNRLQVPKRLEFQPGDHAVPELTGLIGLPNDTWTSVHRWFDRHLRGAANGIDKEAPVQVRPTLGGSWKGYDSWAALEAAPKKLYLSGLTPVVDRTGELAGSARTGWSHEIGAGIDTIANGGTAILTGGAEALGIPQFAWLPGVLRTNAGVWQTPVLTSPATVRGTPKLHVTVTPSSARSTVVAYLYDVGLTGTGRLLTHQPHTLLDVAPGTAKTIDISLDPLVHPVPAGHRIAVVLDTVDGLYRGESKIGGSVTFSSPANNPSRLDLPLG